ncbi:MAG TPA: FAD-dependent oxidoreductase [Anaerolineae bacterium]|nr:FAD-dependent oxidoreductase [Anaerolineae bacterium]
MPKRLIVIGGVAAGMSAAAKAKRVDREMEAIVYEKGPYISYGACGMPYFIAGDVADYRDLLARTPEQMAKQGVEVHVRHEVTAIDPGARTVTVRDLDGEREFTVGYDRLVVATGARPVRPPLPGFDLDGVFVLRALDEGRAVQRFVAERRPRRALILGGGYVGVEMAETFRRLGLDVKMVIRSGQVMRTALDDDVRAVVEEELARHDVEVVTGRPVAFEGNGRVQAVVVEGADEGDRYPCDVALVGIGVRPEVALARSAGVALGATGAIATDSHMRTNLPGVYAAGDCAEAFHLVAAEPAYIPLGSTANKQGRAAGTNAAGGEATFGGVVGTMVVRAFDLAVARTGLTASHAQALGYAVRAPMIEALDATHYFPGVAPIHVKLVVDDETGRLLGGQIAGRRGVAKRIDVLATALHHRLTVADLQRLDLSYAPPFAPVWDPILVAANVAAR